MIPDKVLADLRAKSDWPQVLVGTVWDYSAGSTLLRLVRVTQDAAYFQDHDVSFDQPWPFVAEVPFEVLFHATCELRYLGPLAAVLTAFPHGTFLACKPVANDKRRIVARVRWLSPSMLQPYLDLELLVPNNPVDSSSRIRSRRTRKHFYELLHYNPGWKPVQARVYRALEARFRVQEGLAPKVPVVPQPLQQPSTPSDLWSLLRQEDDDDA